MHAALQAFFNSDLFNQVVVVLLVVMSVLAWAMMRGKRRAIGVGDHLVERGEAVFAGEENPHGIVDRN